MKKIFTYITGSIFGVLFIISIGMFFANPEFASQVIFIEVASLVFLIITVASILVSVIQDSKK